MRKVYHRIIMSFAIIAWVMTGCGAAHRVNNPNNIARSNASSQDLSIPNDPVISQPSSKRLALKKTGYALLGVGVAFLVTSSFLAGFSDHGLVPWPGECKSDNRLTIGNCVMDIRPLYIPGFILGTGALGAGIGLIIRFR